jgi:hypothetical protein
MKQFAVLALAAYVAAPVFAGTNIGVSIGINQPGVYGRIDLGNYPPPAVVYSQPVVVAPTPVAVYQQPIYLYVPVVYQQDWGRYCGRYSACGQPVYFVQEQWVREHHPHGYEKGSYRRSNDDDQGDRGGRNRGRRGNGRGHND